MFIEIKDKDLFKIREDFARFDKDGSGSITINELGSVYKELGHDFSEEELSDMMKTIDFNEDGYITFQEFLSLYKKNVLIDVQEQKTREAFRICDCDGNEFVTFDELKIVMKHVGEHLTDHQVVDLLKEFDFDDDDKINIEEFIQLMKNQ